MCYRRDGNRTAVRLRWLLAAPASRWRGTRGRRVGRELRWLDLDQEQHERGASLHGQRALWLVGDGGSAVGIRDGTPPAGGRWPAWWVRKQHFLRRPGTVLRVRGPINNTRPHSRHPQRTQLQCRDRATGRRHLHPRPPTHACRQRRRSQHARSMLRLLMRWVGETPRRDSVTPPLGP
jgi:hypothetical protein